MIIFVAGVHGVGKTTLCQKLTNNMRNQYKDLPFSLKHESASQLIKKKRSHFILENNKKVSTPDLNQEILVSEVKKLNNEYNTIILDGHFCLLDSFSNIISLDIKVFKNLNLHSVLLIEPQSVEQLETRYKNTQRPPIKNLEQLIVKENEQAHRITKLLNIPLFTIFMDDYNKFYNIMANQIKNN